MSEETQNEVETPLTDEAAQAVPAADPWTQHKRKGLSEMRPAAPGLMEGVSVSDEDMKLPTLEGGWIARNPKNHKDQWYVAKAYYDDNLEVVDQEPCPDREETWFDRLLCEREDLVIQLTALNKFRGSAPGKALTSENKQLLTQQSKTMQSLLRILDARIALNS